MTIRIGRNALARAPRRAVVTIGMFDGLHIAHQRLLRTTVRMARRWRGTSVAVTFDPDPQQILHPHRPPEPLMPLAVRLRLIASLGVDLIWVIRFTPAFSTVAPSRFVESILVRRLCARGIVVGARFAFGQGRRGDLALLRRMGRARGVRVVALPDVMRDGSPVSSSRIRGLIRDGHVAEAARLLGRPHQLFGIVTRGAGRARRLGFPTANVRLLPTLLPLRGVYRVVLRHGSQRFGGVMNLGVRPTFLPARALRQAGGGPLVCEVHLPSFRGSLYGASVSLDLLARLREERRFPTPEALVRQIHLDLRRSGLLA